MSARGTYGWGFYGTGTYGQGPTPEVGDEVGLEIETSRRAWPEAQRLFAGAPERRLPEIIDVGWHGSEVSPETGAIALVRLGGPWDTDSIVGELIGVWRGSRVAYVYVLGAHGLLLEDISLTRRAFASLGPLYKNSIPCVVEVLK